MFEQDKLGGAHEQAHRGAAVHVQRVWKRVQDESDAGGPHKKHAHQAAHLEPREPEAQKPRLPLLRGNVHLQDPHGKTRVQSPPTNVSHFQKLWQGHFVLKPPHFLVAA